MAARNNIGPKSRNRPGHPDLFDCLAVAEMPMSMVGMMTSNDLVI